MASSNDSSNTILGLAYTGSVCSGYKYSIVVDQGGFTNAYVGNLWPNWLDSQALVV